MSAPQIDEVGAPLARIVAGDHDRGLVDEYGLIGDLRRDGLPPVGLVDGAELRRERRRQQARAQIETNLFGALWVTQAALPFLGDQGSGHIIQVSSVGGVTAYPNIGLYHASKWALEGLSQALAQEVAGFGIHVTLIEPGGFETDWFGSSAAHATPLLAYDGVRQHAAEFQAEHAASRGRPEATREAILRVVDTPQPPLRIFFGDGPLATATAEYQSRLDTWRKWEPVSIAAQGRTA